jgi:nucleotide-binding universal stress UspA family protein
MFERGAGMLTGLVVCPAPSDSASEVASISLRRMWGRAVRMSEPLLVARSAITPRRVLVVTDGTARTLPVLRLAFELSERMDASLGYLDAMRIPLLRPAQLGGTRAPQRVHASLQSAAGSVAGDGSNLAHAHAAWGLAAVMAKASARERADVLVVGVAAGDQDTVEKIIETAPCSVLAVPCAP